MTIEETKIFYEGNLIAPRPQLYLVIYDFVSDDEMEKFYAKLRRTQRIEALKMKLMIIAYAISLIILGSHIR